MQAFRDFVKKLPYPIPQILRRIYQKIILEHISDQVPDKKTDFNSPPFIFDTDKLDTSQYFGSHRTKFVGCHSSPKAFSGSLCRSLTELSGKTALVSGHPWSEIIYTNLMKEHKGVVFMQGINGMFALKTMPEIKNVILIADPSTFQEYLRKIVFATPFEGTLVLPATQTKSCSSRGYGNPKPMVVFAFPCAGTNRFIFGFEYLLEKINVPATWFSPFLRNLHVITDRIRNGQEIPYISESTDAIFWRARALDQHNCLIVHEWVDLEKLTSLNIDIVVLMRDPRDIINSYYWHTLPEATGSHEEHLKKIIRGYVRTYEGERAYAFRWPDAGHLCNIYREAMNRSNVHIIRFEDMDDYDGASFRELFNSLGQAENPISPLSKKDYDWASYLGSFEHQTGGKRARGEDHNSRPGGEHSSISIRKGVSGDWMRSFTPTTVALFKELTGDALVELGYETDTNWQL